MNADKKKKLMQNVVVRNLILAASLLIIFMFAAQVLLGLFTRHNRYKNVPDFVGATLEEADHLARRSGNLRIEINDSLYVPTQQGGTILEQKPAAGTEVKSGRRIFVTVNSYSQKSVEVPYVAGFSLRQAKNNLELAGLEIEKLVYQDDIATNYVLAEKVGGRQMKEHDKIEAEFGSGVTLVVGRGDDATVVVPKVVGLTLREAKSRLWEQGLNVGKLAFDNDINALNQRNAKVYAQSPDQGYTAELGNTVTLKLTLDEEKTAKGVEASDNVAKNINFRRLQEAENETDSKKK